MAPPAMTRLRRTLLAALGAAALAVSLAPGSAHASPSADDLNKQLDAKAKQLAAVVEQWDGLSDQLTATTQQAQDAQNRMGPLQAQLDAASQAVTQLAVTSYETSNFGGLTAVLTAGSPQVLIDQLSTLDHLGAQSTAQIAGYTSAKAALVSQQQQLAALLAKQKAQQATLAAQKTKIQADIDALRKQRDALAAQTGSSSSGSGSLPATSTPAVTAKAQIAVNTALAQVGKPYVFGAAGPNSFDCSGLMQYAWGKAGVKLTHYTYTQLNNDTVRISRSQLQPGDLVFFYGGEHVGMYIGNNRVVHAPQPGENVKVSDIDWMNGYYAAGRPRQ